MEVGLTHAFRLAVRALVNMEDFQIMLLAFGITVVSLFSLLALFFLVKGEMNKDEYI